MPKIAGENNSRIVLHIRAEDKAKMVRAASLEHTDLADFMIHHALQVADRVVEQVERVVLSAEDSLKVLDLLENPPAPNARLRAAARRLG